MVHRFTRKRTIQCCSTNNSPNTFVVFRSKISRRRKMKQGVPQGSVISSTLFNLYMARMPTPPKCITLVSYADDCSILATGPELNTLTHNINLYLSTLYSWFESKKLKLSTENSSASLFATWTKEVRLQLNISINGSQLPTVCNPKILGLTFDPLLTFNSYVNITRNNKLKSRNNALKSLAGSDWGKDKETMLTAYKSICKPIMNYASPVWSQQLSTTNWSSLQSTQST